jgi:hypothetical protein
MDGIVCHFNSVHAQLVSGFHALKRIGAVSTGARNSAKKIKFARAAPSNARSPRISAASYAYNNHLLVYTTLLVGKATQPRVSARHVHAAHHLEVTEA